MAHAWRIGPTTVGFNLDEPEELLFIAAFLAARDELGVAEPWLAEVESLFFATGKGLSERALAGLAAALRQGGRADMALPALRPSARTPYVQTRGPAKVDLRQRMVAALRDPARAAGVLRGAQADIAALPAPAPYELEEQEALFVEAAARAVENGASRLGPRLADPAFRARLVRTGGPSDQSDDRADGRAAASPPTHPNSGSGVPGLGPQPDLGSGDLLPHLWGDKLSAQAAGPPAATPSLGAAGGAPPGDPALGLLASIDRKLDALTAVLDRLVRVLEERDDARDQSSRAP